MHRLAAVPLLLTMALATTGCLYEVPFVTEAGQAINPGLLGVWQEEVDEGDKAHPMIVLRLSDTEYLVHYPAGEDGIYYRAYPITIGATDCLQLQVLGTHKGPPEDLETPYTLARIAHAGDKFSIRMVNPEIISKDLKTSAELREAFLKHAANEKLFNKPGHFVRVAPEG